MRISKVATFLAGVGVLALAASAHADNIDVYSGSVSFDSDARPTQTISLPSFDTTGGRILLGVTVDITSDGSVDESGQNLDPFKPASVQARMIRQYRLTGPGVNAIDSVTITSPIVNLAPYAGVPNHYAAPDGVTFGLLSYTGSVAGGSPFSPNPLLYTTAGPGTVNFSVPGPNGSPGSFLLMVNDQNFFGTPPDQWQLQVVNPNLTIYAKVTYDWVPEPTTLSLLGLSVLFLRRTRRH